ncbi:MAG TPA: hypothetical protein VG759_11975 [Candidatus Angelobacter sp.]|nr:hypothetical protein [Candidatus Angelobacter sp.]
MADSDSKEKRPSTVVGTISGLVSLYAVFVFMSGWTFLDFYYRRFGIYTRWLDISITDVLMKGFIILFEGGKWLWALYVFILVVPILFEVFPRLRRHTLVQLFIAGAMLSCLPLTYYISRNAGESAAEHNQSTSSTLADIRFSTDCGIYVGKLLYQRNDSYYIHDVVLLKKSSPFPDKCLVPTDPKVAHELTILRSDSIHDLKLAEY